MNKIHAVDFKLDGSGVVNILDTDVTRDPKKLELRKEPTSFTEDGPVIIRRYDLTDEEHHRQLEKEIFEDTKTAEEKLRAGDPAASIEIRGGFWLRRDCADHWGHCWSVHQAEDQGSGNDDLLQEGSTVAEGFNGGIANVVSEAQSTTLDMPYRITHVKACQGHDQSLIEKVGTSPLAKQVIELAGLWLLCGRSCKRTLSESPDLSTPDGSRGPWRVSHHLPLHVVELSSGHHLHQDFPWCVFVQRPRVYDTTCPLGNWWKRPRCQDIVLGNRHRLRIALWHSPGGNLGRSTHLRRLDPQSLPDLRIRLREVPISLGESWLRRGEEISSAEGLRECIDLEGKRGSEGHSWLWSLGASWSFWSPGIEGSLHGPVPAVERCGDLAQAFDFQGSQHAVRSRRWASSKTKAATSQLQEHPLCCSEAHRLSCRLWCCPRQRAGTPFWSLWPGGIRSCCGGEPYALAVCVDFGNAGADLPQVPEDFPGGHADLSGLWSFSCHYVGHETRLPNLQTWGVGWEARLRAHPGDAGGRWRCRHNAGIQADPFCRRSPEEPCAILHEAGAQGRNVIAPASGNGRPLRFQLCGSGPHAEVHALDYSARQCGASEHQAHKRRNSYWKSTPIQSTHVHRRAGARTDANIGCRRPCFILVQESLLPRQSLCGGVRGPPDPGPVRSSQRRKHHLPVACTDQAGCLRWHPQLRAQHSSASHRSCWYGRRKPTPPCDQADEPGLHQVYQAWVWFSSRSNSRLHTAGVERFLQPVDRSGVGRLASSKPRPSVPRSSVRPRLSLRHRGAEALAWCVSITRGGMASFWKRCRKAEAFAYWDLIRGRWFASLHGWVRDSTNIQTCVC